MDLDFSADTLEKMLLKKSMTEPQWLSILSKVYDKRWFSDKSIGVTIRLILNFYAKYGTIPNQNVILALGKRYVEKYPNNNISVKEISNCILDAVGLNFNVEKEIINENLKGFIRRNAFLYSLMDNAELLDKSQDGYEEVVNKCLSNFDKVQKITFEDADLGLDYFDPAAMESHWEYIKNPEAKIASGWESIDKYTNGGFLKDGKMLAIVMAQAGLGKSVFLSNLAVNFLKENLRVVVISLEMSENVYASRFDAHISNININTLHLNYEQAQESIRAFHEMHEDMRLHIKEFPPRSIRMMDIDRYLENLKMSGKGFDVVIIDYLNLVLPDKSSDSMFKDGLNVSEKMRALSYKYNVPVFTAVQSNTDGMNTEKIGMENISESRGIAHTGDVIFAMYQTDEDRTNGVVCSKVVKNRLGGCVGRISRFLLNPATLVMTDITFNEDESVDDEDDEKSSIEIKRVASALKKFSSNK